MKNILEIKNLTYTYGINTPFCHTAVDDVSFDINENEFIGIIGATGSGKSTLIQMLNGLLKPTAGRVLLDGVDINKDKKTNNAARFKIGLAMQYPEYQLFEETVFKDISFGPKNMGMHSDKIKERVYEVADSLGLDEKILKKSPFDLSGGQKRRVAIAGIMAMKPKVLILDEPTAGLDPRGKRHLLRYVQKYKADNNCTVIFVSHSMEDIAVYCEKILVMNNSRVWDFDKTENIFRHSEEIKKLGLNVPQITTVFNELYKRNLTGDNNIFTVDQAYKYLNKE
ncbi:MAG: energy-coupling factor transporter ATPase [Ruminococcus sp.]|jgi:energy-coupling factor transport system ATP-binding protein|nr:energy-coupling factor transporter ATPase [Ruminococcus sp.]